MSELSKMVLVVDLDKTLCTKKTKEETYADVKPYTDIINAINTLNNAGAEVVIESARNMLTQNNNESKVIKNIGLTTLQWLQDNNVQYDGIKFGKTMGTCYIDDKALRPKEFMKLYESLEDKNDLAELNRRIEEYLANN